MAFERGCGGAGPAGAEEEKPAGCKGSCVGAGAAAVAEPVAGPWGLWWLLTCGVACLAPGKPTVRQAPGSPGSLIVPQFADEKSSFREQTDSPKVRSLGGRGTGVCVTCQRPRAALQGVMR